MLRLTCTCTLGLFAGACVNGVVNDPSSGPSTPVATPEGSPFTVQWVVDGDTLIVQRDDSTETVRLIGIDSPEVSGPHTNPECHGEESTAFARQLLNGRSVRLASDPSQDKRDRFGRLLAYVWRDDGEFVNLRLIEEGFAYEYTYDRDDPYRHQSEFREAEDSARRSGRGLWAPDTCDGDRWAPTMSSIDLATAEQ